MNPVRSSKSRKEPRSNQTSNGVKFFLPVIPALFLFFKTPLVVLAHLGEEVERHPEVVQKASDVLEISPVFILVALGAAAIVGFAAWRFLLKKK